MAITSDQELQDAVYRASVMLQEIHDYCGRGREEVGKVQFPRGLIRTATYFRNILPDYMSVRRKSSCAYGFMFLDVLWWINRRTDLSGVAKEMVIKSGIITLGTILEDVLRIPGQGILAPESNAGVKLRVDRSHERKWISEIERDALKGLWDNRNNVHLHLLDANEFDKYRAEDVNVPRLALNELIANLSAWHVEGNG